ERIKHLWSASGMAASSVIASSARSIKLKQDPVLLAGKSLLGPPARVGKGNRFLGARPCHAFFALYTPFLTNLSEEDLAAKRHDYEARCGSAAGSSRDPTGRACDSRRT